MSQYENILVAIDLSDESRPVIERGLAIAHDRASQLHLIHVIEPLSFAYGGDIPMDFSGIQEEIHAQASQQMQRFCSGYAIAPEQQYIILGKPEIEIHAKAEELGVELIVLGSHGRSGLALLMGSTANGVMHGASCDVLAVRVGKQA